MQATTNNILSATNFTIEVIRGMLKEGISETKYFFALSNIIQANFNLSGDASLIVIENCIKNA